MRPASQVMPLMSNVSFARSGICSGRSAVRVRFWPLACIRRDAAKRPPGIAGDRFPPLDFSLLRNLQRVIHLDAKVAYGTFKLGMPEQQRKRHARAVLSAWIA